MKIAKVIIPVSLNETFDYLINDLELSIGSFVLVEFRRSKVIGLVESILDTEILPKFKLKNIVNVLEINSVSQKDIEFIKWVSNYNLIPLGLVFKMMCPNDITNIKDKTIKKYKSI